MQWVTENDLPNGSANGIGEKPLADFRLGKPASRVGSNLAESSTQVVLVDDAVLEHLVEQPQHSVTSNLLFLCEYAQLPIPG